MTLIIDPNLLQPNTTPPSNFSWGSSFGTFAPAEYGFGDSVYYDDNGYPIIDPYGYGTYGPPQGGVVNVTVPGGTNFTGSNFVGPVASGAGVTPVEFGDTGSTITPGGGPGVIGGTLDTISTTGGFTPGHGSLDSTVNPTVYPTGGQWPNIGIGIPGLIGIGAGGLVTGGLLGGWGGSGGGSQSGSTGITGPVYPGAPASNLPTVTAGDSSSGGGIMGPVVPGMPTGNTNPQVSAESPKQINVPLGSVLGAPNTAPPPPPETTQPGNVIVPPVIPPGAPTVPAESSTPKQTNIPLGVGLGVTVPPPAPSTPSTGGTVSTTLPGLQWNALDRNFYNEGAQSINDLNRLGGGLQGLYSQFAPGYAQTDMNTYGGLLGSLGTNNRNLTGIASQQTQEANRALRLGNMQDAQALGPQAQALQRQLNPEMYANLNALDQAAQRGISASPYEQGLGDMFNAGRSQLGNSLVQTAQDQLRMGGSLSGEEQRAASQAAREGWSARGLVNSTGAVAEEVLNRYNLANQRRNERQGFAQGVFNQEMADDKNRSGLGMSLAGLDYQRQQQGVSNLASAANMRAATSFDPFNFQSTQNVGQNQSLFGNATGFTSGAYGDQYAKNLFNPFAPYPQDVYGSNYNAANARAITQSNNQAAAAGVKDANNAQFVNAFLGYLGTR